VRRGAVINRVAVVSDSVSCLHKELTEKYAIEIVPISLIINGSVYRDGVDKCVELYITDFAPTMGMQAGPVTLALAFYSEEDEDVG